MGKVYILGAGPAGLALADELADQQQDFMVIEKDIDLGGLAKTVAWDKWGHHDLGPHKIFTTDKKLLERVKALRPKNEWLRRKKISRIYMKGHYLPYPPSPFSLAKVFGYPEFIKMTLGYALAQAKGLIIKHNEFTSFEEDLQSRLGAGLYERLFKPIALKLWGDPKDLDVKLSRGRVQTPKISEVILRLLKLQKNSEFEALEFIYPKGGLKSLWDSIYDKASQVGSFELGVKVTGFEVGRDGNITALRALRLADGEEIEYPVGPDDFVFSSLPLGLLPLFFGSVLNSDVSQKIQNSVALNDLLLVFLKIDRPQLFEDSWVFVPDDDIVMHRISEQESFDPSMSPEGSIVCCEVMSGRDRPLDSKSDDELVEMCLSSLAKMGLNDFQVEDSRVIRLPRSYPVYRPGFERDLESVLAEFDKFKNFRTIGRQGAFNYIGTLDAMDIGYGSARWYMRNKANSSAWNQERERTQHYPVLD